MKVKVKKIPAAPVVEEQARQEISAEDEIVDGYKFEYAIELLYNNMTRVRNARIRKYKNMRLNELIALVLA